MSAWQAAMYRAFYDEQLRERVKTDTTTGTAPQPQQAKGDVTGAAIKGTRTSRGINKADDGDARIIVSGTTVKDGREIGSATNRPMLVSTTSKSATRNVITNATTVLHKKEATSRSRSAKGMNRSADSAKDSIDQDDAHGDGNRTAEGSAAAAARLPLTRSLLKRRKNAI